MGGVTFTATESNGDKMQRVGDACVANQVDLRCVLRALRASGRRQRPRRSRSEQAPREENLNRGLRDDEEWVPGGWRDGEDYEDAEQAPRVVVRQAGRGPDTRAGVGTSLLPARLRSEPRVRPEATGAASDPGKFFPAGHPHNWSTASGTTRPSRATAGARSAQAAPPWPEGLATSPRL